MTALRRHLAGYLSLRRGMGHHLSGAEDPLTQFVGYPDGPDAATAGTRLQGRASSSGRGRLVPLTPAAAGALAGYQRSRDQWHPAPHDPALFISPVGTRLRYRNVLDTFTTLVAAAGLPSRPGS